MSEKNERCETAILIVSDGDEEQRMIAHCSSLFHYILSGIVVRMADGDYESSLDVSWFDNDPYIQAEADMADEERVKQFGMPDPDDLLVQDQSHRNGWRCNRFRAFPGIDADFTPLCDPDVTSLELEEVALNLGSLVVAQEFQLKSLVPISTEEAVCDNVDSAKVVFRDEHPKQLFRDGVSDHWAQVDGNVIERANIIGTMQWEPDQADSRFPGSLQFSTDQGETLVRVATNKDNLRHW